ncbi:MAG TPA: hypothetical protein VI451_02445 [Anaerolineales bacterium]|nr:hypothetical protein [Anaerolineales bacterium]
MFNHLPPPFLKQHERILRGTDFTKKFPGTIVQDFQMLLDYVSTSPVELTPNLQLPMKHLNVLNERMTYPILHDFKRPSIKSFPNIQGLCWVLRASGLVLIRAGEKKPVLIVDQVVKQSWETLTPTDQYFYMLETWLFSSTEVIGERAGMFDGPFYRWTNFMGKLTSEGLTIQNEKHQEEALKYWPGMINLALMDFFGLVAIQSAPPLPGKGWRIERITRTPIGDALLALIGPYFTEEQEDVDIFDLIFRSDEPLDRTETLGQLLPRVQPYVPGWQNLLKLPKPEFRDGVYVFKVVVYKDVWRRIAIAGSSMLEELVYAILRAFKFDSDHLWRFIYTDRYGMEKHVYHSFMDDRPFTTEVRVGDIPIEPGMQFLFNFDFGDNWEFEILCEQIDPPPAKKFKTKVLETHGKAPEQYPEW